MSTKSRALCVVKNCQTNIVGKRHLFRFPKEHDRWLQWIRACNRLDLGVMGAEYAYRNYRLCHLHFEENWYKLNKNRPSLHPDAIPTVFEEHDKVPTFEEYKDASITLEGNIFIKQESVKKNKETFIPKQEKGKGQTEEQNAIFENDIAQEETNSDLQSGALLPTKQTQRAQISERDRDADYEIVQLSTSSNEEEKKRKDVLEEEKLRQQIANLKKKVQALTQRNLRLQRKLKSTKNIEQAEKKPKKGETFRESFPIRKIMRRRVMLLPSYDYLSTFQIFVPRRHN